MSKGETQYTISAYQNRPLEGFLRCVLLAAALVIADFFCCLGVQAFMDHVLKVENFIVAAAVCHLACGGGLWMLVRRPATAGKEIHPRTFLLAWIATSPLALFMSLAIDFKRHFTF